MTPLNNLKDLYVQQLKDLYSAETQLVQALPRMEEAATDPQLKEGFRMHAEQTRQHVQRLESVFSDLGQEPGGHTCQAMKGLITESTEMIGQDASPTVKDAGLIACAQRVEHYEIAGYGTVARFAQVLGMTQHLEVLRATENEEKKTDVELTTIASSINVVAAQA